MSRQKIIGVIPARYSSRRFKAKVLADLNGKPMIQHVYERAQKSRRLNDLIIAADDERILQAARGFGAKVILTSPDHACGSDRIAEAVESLPCEIIVNIQGDEPLIDPATIDRLALTVQEDDACQMATVIKIIRQEKDLNDPNVVKVVVDQSKNALYFSRSLIPFDRDRSGDPSRIYYKHLGIYAYRKQFLLTFVQLPKSYLEKIEQLEQLRALEAGYKIKTVLTDVETIAVDTPADLQRVKEFLRKNEIIHS